ncbi:hypothetical protein HNQ93_000409 [Hymenobacter luteus]|uniref:DUF2490 domain-containing protein n=2 Tax=Hymenobacter TaxID=89966 RepID=A0A7W9W9F2_9BACT|nr:MULTISPECIES: DUF2490 domain-containing protein [Hymenobacter]MBB4600111.1 hypothetical protein [Hymenobacter latericoloratus]MBB6057579.1 hypothetical protein [Hymenobacter luteus]
MPTAPLPARGLLLLTSLLLLSLHPGAAQQLHPGLIQAPTRPGTRNAWLLFFSDSRLSKRWGLHAETQLIRARTSELDWQNVVRLGVNYHAADVLVLSGGYAHSRSYLEAGYPTPLSAPEHRLYQQVQLQDHKSRVKFQHRYRLEQRWVQFMPMRSYTYLNRMRYQLRLALPLIGRELAPGVPFVVASDELFLGFGRHETNSLIKQNRAYAGLGYQISKAASVEVGYLNQLVQLRQENRYEVSENIQLSLSFHPDFRRAAPEAEQ